MIPASIPTPKLLIVVDQALPADAYAAWYVYDTLTQLGKSDIGMALTGAYNILPATFEGYATLPFPVAQTPAGDAVTALVCALGLAPDPSRILVCVPSENNSGLVPQEGIVAYHDYIGDFPYCWCPWWGEETFGWTSRDTLTWAVSHEWMEATTDTDTVNGAHCGQEEIGDVCESPIYSLAGSNGDRLMVQSFALPSCVCYQPQEDIWAVRDVTAGRLRFHHTAERMARRNRAYHTAPAPLLREIPPAPPAPGG